MGKLSRNKGAGFERFVVNYFRDETPVPNDKIKRGFQARGGVECPDVDVSGVLWIECKRHKMPNIRKALQQAVEDSPAGRFPVAITRADRDKLGALVTLQLDDFAEIFNGFWESISGETL